MLYHVSRSGQVYGPYTREDLQRYVTSGNVLLTDLAKSEEMTEWLPVSQILGTAGAADTPPQTPFQTPPAYASPAYGSVTQSYPVAAAYAQPDQYPDPPNLSWVICLVLWFFTCSLFTKVWTVVQASWMQKVQPSSAALRMYGIAYAIWAVQWVLGYAAFISIFHHRAYHSNPLGSLLSVAYIVLMILARLAMRKALEEHFNGPEPIGLQLDSIMTVLFGGLYFQYHLTRINDIKRSLRFQAGRAV